MPEEFTTAIQLNDFPLWDKMKARRSIISFDLELTARCPNNCRHCYINLPAGDRAAQEAELSLAEIARIADEAIELGALWCLLTGGEPLLRQDFAEIYTMLKKKGLLVSVFTTATILTPAHIALFQALPPRDIEVTVYGISRETYERVTRRPGSYRAFRRGLDLLAQAGIKVRLKAMALKSNAGEFTEIARFCREHTADYFRFDPQIHLRYDGDGRRNEEIRAERLSPHEIVALEQSDPERMASLEKGCEKLLNTPSPGVSSRSVFRCAAGSSNFTVGPDGIFRLCSALSAPGTTYDLRQGTLRQAWEQHVPAVRAIQSDRQSFLETCHVCPLAELCYWCPAHAYLECGELDGEAPYYCAVAHARADVLRKLAPQP
jgi:radical SAM protein with 4Fe4S-binding SPASM domain